MFQTAFTLGLTHFARLLSLPERLQRGAGRNLSLEPLRQRNATIDAFFYDIKVVTPDEAFYISDSLAAVGSILIVPPSGAGALTLCDTLDEFFLRGGDAVHALAIAGAGGSALGAAAFARNVADALGAPVATVVPGYGLADALAEALGGAFLFGWLNQVRHGFDILDALSGRPQFGVDPERNVAAGAAKNSCRDLQTTMALLADPRLELSLLVGHAKGGTVLSEALARLETVDAGRVAAIAANARIVTVGVRVALPALVTRATAVLGEWDWFGNLNSHPSTATDRRIGGAGHHTNTDFPGHVPVTAVIADILQDAAAVPAQTMAPQPAPIVEPAPEVAAAASLAATVAEVDRMAKAAIDTDSSAEPSATVTAIRKARLPARKPKTIPAAANADAGADTGADAGTADPLPAAGRRKPGERRRPS